MTEKQSNEPKDSDLNAAQALVQRITNFVQQRSQTTYEVVRIVASWVLRLTLPLRIVGQWLCKQYYWKVLRRFAWREDAKVSDTGMQAGLVPKRTAVTLAVSAVVVTLLYLAVGPTLTLVRDIYYVSIAKETTLFFGKPSFNAQRGLYQATACKSKTSCEGGDNALIFDIADNYALDILYTFTRAKGYDPEHEIVSAFNSEYQQCQVTITNDSPLIINYVFGTFRWHPKLLDKAVCTPVVNMN